MPQVFKIGSYWVYFWANENKPLEPVHVHVAEGRPIFIADLAQLACKCSLLQQFKSYEASVSVPDTGNATGMFDFRGNKAERITDAVRCSA